VMYCDVLPRKVKWSSCGIGIGIGIGMRSRRIVSSCVVLCYVMLCYVMSFCVLSDRMMMSEYVYRCVYA